MTDYRPFLTKVCACLDEVTGTMEFALVEDEAWHIVMYPVLPLVETEQYENIVVHYDKLSAIFEECAEGSMTVDGQGLDIVGKYETHEVCLHICFDPVDDTHPFARRVGKGQIELIDAKTANLTLN